jgi:nitrite reductase (NO-forming)
MPGWPKDEAFDGTLAEVGERLFVERGCVRCHTIGHGRKVGPDLAGVTGRDGPAWVIAMMLDPAEMRAHDLRAMGLKRSYHANMANRHLTPDEARAIAEYFLGKDRGLLPERR